ncbi:phosphatidylinositol transfer protein csr1 [Dipsacomyces acuminosporus]|nr:phosphatidylinositol transfer protein csr1 [Dipsacomyces acuminosporus]
MTATNSTESIIDCYKNGTKIAAGTVGHLSSGQEQKLKELWTKILGLFDATANAPVKVANEQIPASDAVGDTPESLSKWYADNASSVGNVKHQTVANKLYLDGKHEPVVPSAFKPLFHDDTAVRYLRNTFWHAALAHQHPDSYLLGFLESKSWDVDGAFDRLSKSIQWRATQAIDKLVWDGESSQHFKIMNDGLTYVAGFDKLGYPVAVVRVRLNIPRERGDGIVEKYAAWTLERASLVSRRYGERSILIYDLSSFKMENIDLKFVKTLITMTNESYPQTYSAIVLFVNSWLFSSVWKLISPWFDPAIAKRIYFAKNTEQLEQFIDKSQMVSELGGNKEYEHKYMLPTKTENERMFDVDGRHKAEKSLLQAVEDFEKQTRVWISADSSPPDIAQSRTKAAAGFAAASASLDPYIRSRFLCERDGSVSGQ